MVDTSKPDNCVKKKNDIVTDLCRSTSVMSQGFASKAFPLQAIVPQPRQGRKNVAHGVSRGKKGTLTHGPAMGYVLARATRAEMINELLTQDISCMRTVT